MASSNFGDGHCVWVVLSGVFNLESDGRVMSVWFGGGSGGRGIYGVEAEYDQSCTCLRRNRTQGVLVLLGDLLLA